MPPISCMQQPTQMKTAEVEHNKFLEEPMLAANLFPDEGRAPWRMPVLLAMLVGDWSPSR